MIDKKILQLKVQHHSPFFLIKKPLTLSIASSNSPFYLATIPPMNNINSKINLFSKSWNNLSSRENSTKVRANKMI